MAPVAQEETCCDDRTPLLVQRYIVRGVGDVGSVRSATPPLEARSSFIYGLNTSSGSVAFQTLVQNAVPPTVRGRAFALPDVTWQSGRLVSIAVGGVLAGRFGIGPLFVGGGALLILAGLVGLATLPPALKTPPTSER